MYIKSITVICLLLTMMQQSLFALVTDSITPLLNQFESLDNLPKNKYSKEQYQEIVDTLRHKEEAIRLVSYNVLFKFLDFQQSEDNLWHKRLPRMVELFQEMNPDVIAIQEDLADQLVDMLPLLNETYAFYGASDAPADQELNGIYYKIDRFELLEGQTWVFQTEPYSTTLNMALLKDLKTGQSVAIFNTHAMFEEINQRDFQVREITSIVESYAKKVSVILTGDMNLFPHRLDLTKLPFYDGDYLNRIFTRSNLKNVRDRSILGHLGPIATFTNAPNEKGAFKGKGEPGIFLDNSYVSNDIGVIMHAVQPAKVDGHFPSDHMPLVIDFYVDKGN